jgi:hypothetical protein
MKIALDKETVSPEIELVKKYSINTTNSNSLEFGNAI